jgi:DNA-binding NtrC family response regulator
MSSVQPALTVLAVDDDQHELDLLHGMISSLGYTVETASHGEEALAKLDVKPIAAIVTDLFMPRLDGFGLLRALIERGQQTPAIVYTGFGDTEQAVSVVHELRAFWFLEKPARLEVLGTLLSRAIQYGSLVQETGRLQRELGMKGVLGELVGVSDAMQQVFTLIQRVAPTQASVLITGESGTGKELVARTVHKMSPRSANPFVAVNCAALPETLIESELFGYERGAFTGAVGRHPGCFEQADGGTLFLDEIGEMPAAMQARLLRALEESKVRRLGGTSEIAVDVRVLAATNRPVQQAIEQKALREDLYYRLNVFNIHLPPLRDRLDDLPAMADAILGDVCRKLGRKPVNLHVGTLERLAAHSWPGNARELRNVLEWAMITAGDGTLLPRHLPKTLGPAAGAKPVAHEDDTDNHHCQFELGRTLEHIEQEYVAATLKLTNNDRKKAARLLGISLRTLYNRLADSRSPSAS